MADKFSRLAGVPVKEETRKELDKMCEKSRLNLKEGTDTSNSGSLRDRFESFIKSRTNSPDNKDTPENPPQKKVERFTD